MRRILILVLSAVLAAMSGAAAVLDRISRLFDGGGSSIPTPPVAITPDEVCEKMMDAYEREAAADEAIASDLGQAIHQYAAADDPGIRCAVDLGGLNPA